MDKTRSEQEMEQQLNKQYMKDHAVFMEQAIERGLALPCHTETPSVYNQKAVQKYLER